MLELYVIAFLSCTALALRLDRSDHVAVVHPRNMHELATLSTRFGLRNPPPSAGPNRLLPRTPPRYAAQKSAGGKDAGILDGKVALVTGGGGGIGRATALAMVREGARVAVADFDAAAARDTVAQINGAGGQAITLTGDVTSAEAVAAWCRTR